MSFVVTCTLIMVNILADAYLGILYELVEYSNECYLYEIAERVGDSYAALRDNGVDKKEWEKTYNTLCEGTFIDSWNEPYDTMGFIIDTYLRGEGIKDIANKLSLFDNPKVYVKIIGNKVTAQLYYGKNCEKDKYMYCEYEIPNEIE